MKLDAFFDRSRVIELSVTEKQPALKEMVRKLEELGDIQHADRYYAQVVHRESLENTGIGKGLAIPHARTDSVQHLSCVFAVAKEGFDYQSFDGQPVRFLLLSIFPTDTSTKYLYLVSMMAKIFSDDEKVAKLNLLASADDVYDFLSVEADAYFESISEKSKNEYDHHINLAGVPTSDLDLLIRLDRLYKSYDSEKTEILLDKIQTLRKLMDNRSLTYYERMRKKCQNPFSILEKEACAGCHMNIPPAELNDIRERKKISVCPHCGRFIIIL